jgi:hypothetical protein
MITIAGVQCQELVADLTEGADLIAGPIAQKGFLCPWTSRLAVAQGILGLNTAVSLGTAITINTPLPYPDIPNAYAHTISIQGVGSPTQGPNQIQWPFAIISVNYQALHWSFAGINFGASDALIQIDPSTPLTYCEQRVKVSTTWITIPGTGLKFANGNKLSGRNVSIPLCQMDMQLTFMRVPYMPAQTILNGVALAPLNSATFLGQQPGFMLFNGMDTETSNQTDGSKSENLTMSISWRNIPWDQDWDPVGQAFSQVQNGSTGSPLLARSDLNQLIPSGYLL